VVLASRIRAQTAYRASFGLDVLANVGIGLLELAEIYVIFHNVDVLGGLTAPQALLMFAISNICFALADLLVGHVDTIPTYLRQGTLDALLLRPQPVLLSVITSDLSLKRLGRALVAVPVLAAVIPLATPDFTWASAGFLAVTVVAGTAIFAAVFVWVGALQFWLVEGGELGNAFTYGGSYAAQYPASVYGVVLRTFWTFVVPATFVAYLPTLLLTDTPGPPGLPSWLGYLSTVAAVVAWIAGVLAWRAAVRHYTGAGG
jgi:ABC-2 type transport system permease protein